MIKWDHLALCWNFPIIKNHVGYHTSRKIGCFQRIPWPYFLKFPNENQWVSGQHCQVYYIKKWKSVIRYYPNKKWKTFFHKKSSPLQILQHQLSKKNGPFLFWILEKKSINLYISWSVKLQPVVNKKDNSNN